MFRKLLGQGEAGDNVGVLLRGTREEVEEAKYWRNQDQLHLIQNSRLKHILTKDEGGVIHLSLVIIGHSFILEQQM